MAERQRGFTAIELLIVIQIIGIIAGIAVPTLLSSRRSANGASAIEATRLFHSGEVTYQVGVGNGSFGSATNLFEQGFIDGVLAGAAGVSPGANSNQGLHPEPASSAGKSGYQYSIMFMPPTPDQVSRFTATATPVAIHRTGDRSFFVDETGVIRFSCSPPKHWSEETKHCEPQDEVTDGVAIGALAGIDGLTADDALKMVLANPPDDGKVQKVLGMLDANGDRMLTLREVARADVLAMARMLAGSAPDTRKPQQGDKVLERLLKQFKGDLARELALGVGNEDEAALPYVEMKGSIVPLLELATLFTSPIKR